MGSGYFRVLRLFGFIGPEFFWLISAGGGTFEPGDSDVQTVNFDEAIAELFCVVDFFDGVVGINAIVQAGPFSERCAA